MNAPPKEMARHGENPAGHKDGSLGGGTEGKRSTTRPNADRPFTVVVDGTRRREWGRYSTNAEAVAVCAALRKHGFHVRIVTGEVDQPEHRNDRRRFLVFALMIGAVPPSRVVERIVADIECEAAL